MTNGAIVIKEDILEKIGTNIRGDENQGQFEYPGAYEYFKEVYSANKVCIFPKFDIHLGPNIVVNIGPQPALINYNAESINIEGLMLIITVETEYPNRISFSLKVGG